MEVMLTSVSIARLHGEACWHCGAVYASLFPAGSVVVNGHEWLVVVCEAHRAVAL